MEGLLAILLAGGMPLQSAVWANDAALLYVGACSVMSPAARDLTTPMSAELVVTAGSARCGGVVLRSQRL